MINCGLKPCHAGIAEPVKPQRPGHPTGGHRSVLFTTLQQCFSLAFTLIAVIEKWFNDVLWGPVFNFLFASLCVPCGHSSNRAGVSNGSAGNNPGTSTIKVDERQDRVVVGEKCFTVKDARTLQR